ncbi:hypothetical protein VOLCADRAFT_121307 [Volvox carteri f. nagariensis]|uniref:SH3 domain-containing protein n=1 Tax=Volvox carteri f. nagariensis TaxID=3068 RepID=D8U701_VOLCA|nr:uncharacterized protein VOLCADRAFT_121307 [Volvox carteri f. nagariensis]EFJ44601.1 hypothetical protein VOLCADRAFT_121307 [Volvox carteri f. nagariensis]|eukprot:XP_002954451.1 hypothetical protein VOLCADRAFT_121307 [Volvox carteri f. nagariensis]
MQSSPQKDLGIPGNPTPAYNNYIRSTLGKGESPIYDDYCQGLGALKAYDEKQSEIILKQLSRLLQYGHFTIAGVQLALQVQRIDIGRDEKALMRIVQYLVLLGLGDGSAGTPLPVRMNAGGMVLTKAVDQLGLDALMTAWNDLGNERATFVRKQAALRALAAITRASLTSRPDDATYVQGLYETLRGLMDKVDALRAGRRGLAHIISQAQGNKKKNLVADMRQRVEMWSLLRAAFAAARLALPRSGLYKVAQRSLSALGSSDPVCARHALALSSLVARDPAGCGSFIAAVEPLLKHNVETAKRTGDVSERGAVFWQALVLLAVADPSERVALEAIRAMFGAPYPRATTAAAMRAPGAGTRISVASSPVEVEAESSQSKILGASWHLVMTQALEQPPVTDAAAGGAAAAAAAAADSGIFGRIARRLLRCLQSRSQSLVCGAARAAAVLAESRAWFHSLSGGHGHEAEPEGVRRWMRSLQGFLLMLAGDDNVSGCERAAALEALIWSQGIDQPPTVSPGLMLRAASHGGFTAAPIARYTFADPWPSWLLAEMLGVLARRLRCTAGMPAELVLELAGALAAGSPSGMPREALQTLWDLAPGPLAARAALQLLSAPLPPLCQPPASAAVEVKSIAAQAEMAFYHLKAMAACWLGEHVNSIAGEYAWKSWETKMGPAADAAAAAAAMPPEAATVAAEGPVMATATAPPPPPPAAPQQHRLADGRWGSAGGGGGGGDTSSLVGGAAAKGGCWGPEAAVARMAEAAVSHSPLLAMTMAHLNRGMLTGANVVRVAAAQALAKLSVRSGEPYRIQCYSLLSAAAGRIGGVSGGGGGTAAAVVDPLGLAPVVGPALEVLDAMYAGELVLERHVSQYGTRAHGWPEAALESLRRRHEWLLGAISCTICAVPRELFLPLGPRSRRLLFPSKYGSWRFVCVGGAEVEADDKEDAEEDARQAAAAEAQQQQEQQYGDQQYYDEYGQPYQYDYSAAEQYDYGDYYNNAAQQQQQQQQQEDRDQYGQQRDPLARLGAMGEARPGVVLYSFQAETEGEVSVTAGESVRVVHDLGEWYEVLTAGGQQGVVPASYVQLSDEQQGGDGGAGGGGGGGRGRGHALPTSLASQASVGSAAAGALSAQSSFAVDYYTFRYDNPEYDSGNGDGAYGSYYGDYGSQYGADQYGTGAYGNGAYGGGGMYGDDGGSSATAERGGGGKKKKGFGGFDDFGAVLAEVKNAAAAARQQQQSTDRRTGSDGVEDNRSSGGGAAAAAAAATISTAGAAASPSLPQAEAGTTSYVTTPDAAAADVVGNVWSASGQQDAAPGVPADGGGGGGRGTAMYEFVAEMPGELSVAAGEELEVLGPEADGWYTARLVSDPSRVGIIPASYVQLQQ